MDSLKSILPFFLFFFLSLSSCQNENNDLSNENNEKRNYVATVNNEKILLSELEDEIRFISQVKYLSKKEVPVIKTSSEGRKNLINEMINERLILQEADKMNVKISKRELQQEIKKIIEVETDVFKQNLKKVGISYFEWKERLKRHLKIKKLIRLVILNNIVITDEELTKYYETNKSEFFKPAGVDVQQILFKSEAEANIVQQQLLSEPNKWDSFVHESISHDRESDGYMGFFSKGELPEDMEQAIFSLELNKISPVIKTAYGYHIFKVTNISKAQTIPFSKVRTKIYQLLSTNKVEIHYQDWLNKVRNKSSIIINYEAH
ncbi:MAG: peptidyl-prolyl cis-trans isomerase [Nitrospinae bacterium]|nr:peptidyl-prolyl cis-trans isomerase [Nitrospinota bacterium]